MVTGIYLASTVVMGLLAAGVFYVAVNGPSWRRYSPRGIRSGWRVGGLLTDTRAWILTFLFLTVAAVAGLPTVLESGGDVSGLILVGSAVPIVAFLLVGTYATARSHGHPHSHAVAQALGMFGGVVILAIVANLLIQFGA